MAELGESEIPPTQHVAQYEVDLRTTENVFVYNEMADSKPQEIQGDTSKGGHPAAGANASSKAKGSH